MIQDHFLGADSFAYFSNNVHVFNFTEQCACVQFYRMLINEFSNKLLDK